MYLWHSLIYLLAKLSPALASLVVLAVYTRWMNSYDYGLYSTLLILASSGANFMFGWLYVSIMRFWNNKELSADNIHALIAFSVLLGCGFVGLISSLFAWFSGQWLVAGLFFMLFSSVVTFEAYQRVNSITLKVNRYLVAEVMRTLLATSLGLLLVALGYAWAGALAAMCIAVLMVLLAATIYLKPISLQWQQVDFNLLRTLLKYGLPLSLSLVLLEIIHVSDRLLLGAMQGYGATGEYAVAFNLPHQIMMLITSSLNLAAYPLVIRSLESDGKQAAQQQLHHYHLLLMGVAIPAAFGLVGIGEPLLSLIIGEEFLATSVPLLPWVVAAVFMNCSYLFYISLGFQLMQHTLAAVKVVAFAAALNILGNIILIPLLGLKGAVLASLLAYLVCLVYGYYRVRRYLVLPCSIYDLAKILLAAVWMLGLMQQVTADTAMYILAVKISLGVASYAVFIVLLNPGDIRSYLKLMFSRLLYRSKPDYRTDS